MINSNRKIARIMLMGILLVFTHTSFVYAAEPWNAVAAEPKKPSLFSRIKTGLALAAAAEPENPSLFSRTKTVLTIVASEIVLEIQSLAITQADLIGQEMQTQVSNAAVQCVIDQAKGPVMRIAAAAPGAMQKTLRYVQQKSYAKTEHHQPFFESLPWASSSGACALAAGLLCALKPEPLVWSYATAGFFGLVSLATLYKAITTYRSTVPIHADATPTRVICNSPFITRLIQELQSPDQQLVLAVESQNSFYLNCQNQSIRQNFARYLATQSGLPLFTVQAQELIDNASLIDRYIQRATLAAQAGEYNGALIYIENFELLSKLENQALAAQLSGHISMQTNVAFNKIERLKQIDARNRFREHTQQDALESVAQENDLEKKLHEAQIFFIAGIDRDGESIGEPFRSKNQFATTLELKIDASRHDDSAAGAAGPADESFSISCGQTGQILSFDPLPNYVKFDSRWGLTAQTVAQEYSAEKERTKKAKRASSSQTLRSIAGGYPHEIDTIVHIINTCKDRHGIPSIHGILLYGPAGCGKTYLARSLAGTLSVPFFTVKIADILSDREQASTLLNDRFKEAQTEAEIVNGIAILFIDECDELLQAREHAPEYIAPIAFNLRSILSGFDATYNRVVLIVATNNPPEKLDGTLLRSGRFDYKIHIDFPTNEERAAVIAYHAAEKHLDLDGVFIATLAEHTARLSKSDLAMLIDKGAAETAAHAIPLQQTLINELKRIKEEAQPVRESASQTEDIPALKTWRTLWL